jgi:hypothetical protein
VADNILLDGDGNAPAENLATIEVAHSGSDVHAGLVNLITTAGAELSRVATLVGSANPLPVAVLLGTPSLATVDDSASAVTLAAANASRTNLTIYNDSDEPLAGNLGGTAGLTDFNFIVGPGQFWHMLRDLGGVYRGAVSGIWLNNSTGTARVTDFTAA